MPFAFTGKFSKITLKIDRPRGLLSSEPGDIKYVCACFCTSSTFPCGTFSPLLADRAIPAPRSWWSFKRRGPAVTARRREPLLWCDTGEDDRGPESRAAADRGGAAR